MYFFNIIEIAYLPKTVKIHIFLASLLLLFSYVLTHILILLRSNSSLYNHLYMSDTQDSL